MSPIASQDVKAILAQTRTQWLRHRASKGDRFDKLVIGAAVFRQTNTSDDFQLLIIRRAANESYYPNCFEMPSGKVDDGETIGEAIARELFEETGLTLSSVLAQIPEITYTTEKIVLHGGREVQVVKTACQLNFAVETTGDVIELNEEEHSEWKWATVEEMAALQMTGLMRECTKEALEWAEAYLG
jgi:8-oxo-dGTP diphosphatase